MKQSVLFILHLPPPIHGAAMMGKYIHDSKIINKTFDCQYINMASAKTLDDIGKKSIRKYLQYLNLLKKVIWQVLIFRPQLVYVTPTACGIAFYKDFLVVELLKLLGCKVVIHFHNKGVATRQNIKIDNKMYHCFFKHVKVILLAEALYTDVKKYVKRKDVFICPNGISENGRVAKEKHYNTITKLLFLSNLIESKGIFVLLDALKILKEQGGDFSCDFVGDETQEINAYHLRKEIDERGLTSHVTYLGKKSGKEKEEIYNKADIFILPTFYYNECFPLVLLEAMQHALPCISTNEGGICDIIKDGKSGFVVEKNNPLALANKIRILLEEPSLRKKMGEYGYLLYKKNFTLHSFECNLKTCLETILS